MVKVIQDESESQYRKVKVSPHYRLSIRQLHGLFVPVLMKQKPTIWVFTSQPRCEIWFG